ncbi:biphenyl-2,3-diol 1,2-dioxygenase 2 [Colletotrichum kahawae]|uniref:Biphenyl-2,3-diol 1,2-dioxygenase 2 n=1 Tax=Colletotrichum kahawae TaxID=34407 RepID=A0AAD9YDP6_COLKA|nr:biphenyl-2,3-diol 1,2-dioxygenase 2 [Colletotrichum kahawae]
MTTDRVPAPSSIAHIGLRTRNPEKLVSFYQALLGAQVVLTNDFISVLTWDEEHHRLAIIHDANASPKQANASGLDHIALKFASAKDLAQVYSHAKEADITPKICLNHGVTTSLYYTDPDGNNIEAQIEAYNDPEDVQRHMKALDPTNIKAVKFDPEELLRRVDAGEDNESLRKAGLLGPQPAPIVTSMAKAVAGGN